DLVSSVTVDVNVVSPDPLPVTIASPDPLPVEISTPIPLDVNVVSPDPLPVEIANPLNNQGNAVMVEAVDKIRPGIITLMYDGLIVSSTLAVEIVSQDRDITLVDATGFNAGDSITNLAEASDSNFPVVIVKVGNVLTLDRLIDGNFPIGTVIDNLPVQMNVIGTPASPVVYKVAPPPGEVWHLTRSMISMTHSSSGDMGKFGGISALTYGVQGRVFNDGAYTTFINWKTNGDLALSMYDVKFDSRSGG
ncbi:unnamed protein product, partial [marine sediment metagenome]